MNCTSTFIRNPDHGSGLSLSFAERYKPLGASGFQACRQRGNLLRVTNVNPEQKSHRSQGRSCQNGKMDLRESEGRGAVSPILLVRELYPLAEDHSTTFNACLRNLSEYSFMRGTLGPKLNTISTYIAQVTVCTWKLIWMKHFKEL